mmetsp:Transcript_21398/g.72830  ORF Transcript_21398/g.72830 Transcript_21398/m.72830 type:complete len:122 (+) Transcript_21398:543-908(+)
MYAWRITCILSSAQALCVVVCTCISSACTALVLGGTKLNPGKDSFEELLVAMSPILVLESLSSSSTSGSGYNSGHSSSISRKQTKAARTSAPSAQVERREAICDVSSNTPAEVAADASAAT